MLTEIFTTIHDIGMSVSTKAASLCRDFSYALCDQAHRGDLDRIYSQADYIKNQVNKLRLGHHDELDFMAEVMEISGTPDSFSELMGLWDGRDVILGNEASDPQTELGHSFSVSKAAERFNDHFERLPRAVQKSADWALSLHRKAIIKPIEEKIVENVQCNSQKYIL